MTEAQARLDELRRLAELVDKPVSIKSADERWNEGWLVGAKRADADLKRYLEKRMQQVGK